MPPYVNVVFFVAFVVVIVLFWPALTTLPGLLWPFLLHLF